MFSGFNEIALIVIIAGAIIFLPGLMAKRSGIRTPRRINPSGFMIPWQIRLIIIVSVLWLVGTALYFRPWLSDPIGFLCFGVGPVASGLGIGWVIHGYRSKK